jgi:hypothetical protein
MFFFSLKMTSQMTLTRDIQDNEANERRVLREIQENCAPTSETGQVQDDCNPSPFKEPTPPPPPQVGVDECGRGGVISEDVCGGSCLNPFANINRTFKYHIKSNSPVKIRLEGGLIEVRSKRSMVVPASSNLSCPTGMKLSRDEESEEDVSYAFIGIHGEGGIKTRLANENQSVDVDFEQEVVIQINNYSTTSVQLVPGSFLGTFCTNDNRYITNCQRISNKKIKLAPLCK